jgi:hypothetical protein
MRERYPITFVLLIAVVVLFVLAEAAAWVITIRDPCVGCIDNGAILIWTPIMFLVFGAPIVGAGWLVDVWRRRRVSRLPPRPDGDN